MLKKTIGTVVTAAALIAGLGSMEAEASQWNHSSVNQSQSNSGWTTIHQEQREVVSGSGSEYNGSRGSAQGQAGFTNGFQVQSGKSNGPATASQTSETRLDVGDVQGGNATVTNGSWHNFPDNKCCRTEHFPPVANFNKCSLPFPGID